VAAVNILQGETLTDNAFPYLLVFDSARKTVEVRGFQKSESAKADEKYLRAEKDAAANLDVQALLVSVDSVTALRSAYPNHYADTSAFLNAVQIATMGSGRSKIRNRRL
jgi:hypothetical protein